MSVQKLLKFVREDDFVEYYLFPHFEENDTSSHNDSLQSILTEVLNVIKDELSSYIWHKDEFNLVARTGNDNPLLEENVEANVCNVPPHLYGVLHYGENIQDEWFIVYLLFKITSTIPGIIGRVIDSDGEFLLIEAAEKLPKWANPDTCEQRVFIHEGNLLLVQNSPSNTTRILPIKTALNKIWENSALHKVPDKIQDCVKERFKDFSSDMKSIFHKQRVRVPVAVAALLQITPSLIAPACRAFCHRDDIDMKACRAMRYFPPENRVRITVKFTRCLYAMLMANHYVPDRRTGWKLPPIGTQEYIEDVLGIKIACGFEILRSEVKDGKNLSSDRMWCNYFESLKKKGYFKDFLEGSKDYNSLLNKAKHFYEENRKRFRTFKNVGEEIFTLQKDIDIDIDDLKNNEEHLERSDDDSWLKVSSDELDGMLKERYGNKKLFNIDGTINANEFTKNVEDYLNEETEIENMSNSNQTNIKNISNIKNIPLNRTNEINFDADAFHTHVKNLLDFVVPEDDWSSNSDMSDYEDENGIEKNIEDNDETKKVLKFDFKTYMDQMDRELSTTTIGKTFVDQNEYQQDDFDDIETFKPINIDSNTVKNMINSYKMQNGNMGPTSSLLGAMGIGFKASQVENDNSFMDVNDTEV